MAGKRIAGDSVKEDDMPWRLINVKGMKAEKRLQKACLWSTLVEYNAWHDNTGNPGRCDLRPLPCDAYTAREEPCSAEKVFQRHTFDFFQVTQVLT